MLVDHSYDDEDDELIADCAAPETVGDPTAWAAADAADHPLALPPPPTATAVEAEEAARMVAAHLQQGLGIPRFSTLFDGRAGTCALERKRPRGEPPAAWSSSVAVAESAEAQLLGKAHKGRRREVPRLLHRSARCSRALFSWNHSAGCVCGPWRTIYLTEVYYR